MIVIIRVNDINIVYMCLFTAAYEADEHILTIIQGGRDTYTQS
jgi:hypothetical protein